MILQTVLIAFSALLLAAHFLRWGDLPLMAVSLLFPLLLLIHKRWALLTVQVLTFTGAAVWANSAYQFLEVRVLMGEPWGRLAVILGAVILLTCTAALSLGSKSVRRKYPKSDSPTG